MNEYQPALATSAGAPLSSLSWGAEFRALFTLAWPLIIAQLARSALFTTDVIVLGWLGASFVAAGALANALFVCTLLFGIGVVGAVAPMAAQAIGARDFRTVRRTVRSGMWLAVALFVLLFPDRLEHRLDLPLDGSGPRAHRARRDLHSRRDLVAAAAVHVRRACVVPQRPWRDPRAFSSSTSPASS